MQRARQRFGDCICPLAVNRVDLGNTDQLTDADSARTAVDAFFPTVDRPRGTHLCGNPDWDFLLNLELVTLSMDISPNAEISCAFSLVNHLSRMLRVKYGSA